MKVKFRVRVQGRSTVITLQDKSDGEYNALDLRRAIESEFGLAEKEFYLSLNGVTALDDNGAQTSLSELGIVPGDLVKVILVQDGNYDNNLTGAKAKQARMSTSHESSQSEISASANDKHMSNADQEVTESTKFKTVNLTSMETNSLIPEKTGNENMEDASGSHLYAEHIDNESDPLKDPVVNKCLNEPLTCQEASDNAVSQLLHTIYNASDIQSKTDALVLVVHVLMLETGFQVKQKDPGFQQMRLPDDWKTSSFYKIIYSHKSCDTLSCVLKCVSLGSLLTIQGIVQEIQAPTVWQIHIKPDDHIQQIHIDAAKVYKNLPRLSRTFKDKIAYPLLNTMKQELGLPCDYSILGMVEEIQLKILSYLDMKSLITVAATCKNLQEVAKDPMLWRRLYLRTFGRRGSESDDLSQNWYEMFKQAYIARQNYRRQMASMRVVVPPFIGPPHPTSPFIPGPVYPPGFIGGSYDVDPFGGMGMNPLQPRRPLPRFDPFGPLPDQAFRPGRGGGMFDRSGSTSMFGGGKLF